MKTKLSTRKLLKNLLIVAAPVGLIFFTGCSTTQKANINQSELNCSLLGNYCSKLTPGSSEQMGLRYVNPNAKWSQYSKVFIAPVTYWGNQDGKLSQADQQNLINYFQNTLREKFSKNFQVVDEPTAGAMTLTVALTEADSATPVLRTISMVVPQARLLSTLKYLPTGTYPFVGGAQVEAKLTDSSTGEVLGAAVDRRLGGGNISTGFQWRWGDVQNSMDFWAEAAAKRLGAWRDGTEKPN